MKTNAPPTGYYRALMPKDRAAFRIAQADKPMTGVRPVAGWEKLAAHFDTLSDPHAAYYAAGLRAGSLLLIEIIPEERRWAPGELFLKS